MEKLLDIQNLTIRFDTDNGCVHAVNDLTLTLHEGETLGIVGETGAGKTTLARGIMGLVPQPAGKVVSGSIIYQDQDLLTFDNKQMQGIRGKHISMIFQDPMTSLNPVTPVGDQIAEAILSHERITK